MKLTYTHWLFADQANRDIIMRNVFERLEQAEAEIAQMKSQSQPLDMLANSPKSWLPKFKEN